ncbi:MAG TPA: serine/threonine-protein kinase [Polyangiaceae bacterium]
MHAQPVHAGSVVARRYRATRKIASGAMGEVWEAVHVELGHRVAIKVLQPSALECREILVRFAREAFLLARVDSEHVARAIDFAPRGRHGPALVLELVDGPTFADVIRDQSCSIEYAADVAIDVLRGLRAMHARGIVHRDVKPGNVIVQRLHDGTKRAVLIDLGVARMQSHASEEKVVGAEITTADRVVGTLEYMAPEQIASCQTAGPQADVYAVGAMIYRAIAGSHPFGDKRGVDLLREKVRKPMPRLRTGRRDFAARKLEAIVARAVSFSPRDRYANADAMLADLEALRDAMRSRLHDTASAWSFPKLRRRKAVLALAAACATAIAACSTEYVRRSPPVAHEVGVIATTPQ